VNSSTCIYMYCNIERKLMENKSGSPSFGIQGKISMYLLCVSRHCIFYVFKNLFVDNLCTGLK